MQKRLGKSPADSGESHNCFVRVFALPSKRFYVLPVARSLRAVLAPEFQVPGHSNFYNVVREARAAASQLKLPLRTTNLKGGLRGTRQRQIPPFPAVPAIRNHPFRSRIGCLPGKHQKVSSGKDYVILQVVIPN